ncbi:MAG: hypothetical protein OEM96_07445 [Gemmatimonadota bacterium]|nr:hypothetical protein [Gemmatimonadota bacterium]
MTNRKPRRARTGTRAGLLPQEVHSSPSARSVAALVVGVLAVTGAINLTAVKLLEGSDYNSGYRRIQEAWSRLDGQSGPADWLVLGDSGCGNAVVPAILEQSLEGSVTELCTIGNMGLLDDAWLLGTHIELYGPPARGVLLVHVYDVWQRASPPVGLLAHVPRPLGFWSRFEPPVALDWHESVDLFMARHLPLVGARESLESMVNGKIRELRGDGERPSEGAQVVDTARVLRDYRRHVGYADSTGFAIAPKNLEALDRIAGLAAEHEFSVYLANGPLWEGLAADPSFQRYNSEMETVLSRYARDHPAVHYLGGTMTFALTGMTRTVDHVQQEPAIRYSRNLAERLR